MSDQQKGLYVVCGAGETGATVIGELLRQKYRIVAVDKDSDVLDHVAETSEDIEVVKGNALDDDILKQAGIADAAGLFAALPDDRENAYLCLSARRINRDLYIVARIKDPDAESKLRLIGVNSIVNQSRVEGFRIFGVLLKPDVVSITDQMLFNPDCEHSYCSIPVPGGSRVRDRKIREIDITKNTGVVLIAVRKATGKMIYNPGPREKIQEGDSLIAFATAQEVEAITALLK